MATTSHPGRGLTRSRENRAIAGVCAGLHRYYGWDTALVRIIFVVTAILLFPLGLIAYGAAWVLVPEEPLLLPMPTSYPGVGPANAPAPTTAPPVSPS